VHLADGLVEYDLIEFLHHLSGAEAAEIAAALPGGALRV
jgi:hypothetical protein